MEQVADLFFYLHGYFAVKRCNCLFQIYYAGTTQLVFFFSVFLMSIFIQKLETMVGVREETWKYGRGRKLCYTEYVV
jgi:predicted membrane metal-binding protein